jgi:hypothetical protein
VKRGVSGMRTSEIAKQVGVGLTNLSFHLTELGRSGLLRRNRGALLREARIKKLERQQLLGGRPTDFAELHLPKDRLVTVGPGCYLCCAGAAVLVDHAPYDLTLRTPMAPLRGAIWATSPLPVAQ